tara:strand:+ start:762 stop:1262 length:501 start_codon:yes stop_codon:yes gene_type:complete
MKNLLKTFILIAFVGVISSCSSEDSSNGLDDVPSGEIVSVEKRQFTLTGFSDSPQNSETQKWWTHVISKASVNGPEECGEDETQNDLGYIAFYEDGGIYYKTSISGSAQRGGSWEWTNSDKNSIITQNIEFTVTYLNDTNVVYGSFQTSGPCSATTYEKFNNPFFD